MAVLWSKAVFHMKFKSTSARFILFREHCDIRGGRKPRCTVKMQRHWEKLLLGLHPGQTPMAPGFQMAATCEPQIVAPKARRHREMHNGPTAGFQVKRASSPWFAPWHKELEIVLILPSQGNETSNPGYLACEDDEALRRLNFRDSPAALPFRISPKTSTSWCVWLHN